MKKTKNKIDQTRHFTRLIAIQKADRYMILCGEENGLLTSPYCESWQFCSADTMFWYYFRILPDRLKLIRLYPCGSLGPGISFIFGARAGHFAEIPPSDVVCICAHDFGVMAMLSVRQKMPFFRAFNPQIIISPTSSSTASFNGNRVKNHPKPWTCPLRKTAQQSIICLHY